MFEYWNIFFATRTKLYWISLTFGGSSQKSKLFSANFNLNKRTISSTYRNKKIKHANIILFLYNLPTINPKENPKKRKENPGKRLDFLLF